MTDDEWDSLMNDIDQSNDPGTGLNKIFDKYNNSSAFDDDIQEAAERDLENAQEEDRGWVRGMRSRSGSNDSDATRQAARRNGTNFDEMTDQELDKIISEGDTSRIGGSFDIHFHGAMRERNNRRNGVKPSDSNDSNFDIPSFTESFPRPTSRRNSRQSPPDNRLLGRESGTRSRSVPKTFNDYVENPHVKGCVHNLDPNLRNILASQQWVRSSVLQIQNLME